MRRATFLLLIILGLPIFIGGAWLSSPGNGIPVLTYHQIGPGPNEYSVDAADFERQLIFLRENGYSAVGIVELTEGLTGKAGLPSRPIVITFDDGYEDNYHAALPVLERQGMKGTFFLVTGKMGQPGYMNWKQAREMTVRGMEIGSHTVHHYALKEISLKEMERELLLSRLMLESNVPESAPIFANPFGQTAPELVQLIKRTGYRAACSSVVGLNRPDENLFMIRRLNVRRSRFGLLEFRLRLWWLNMTDRLGL